MKRKSLVQLQPGLLKGSLLSVAAAHDPEDVKGTVRFRGKALKDVRCLVILGGSQSS